MSGWQSLQGQTTAESLVGTEVTLMKTFVYANYFIIHCLIFYMLLPCIRDIPQLSARTKQVLLSSVPICKSIPSKAFKKFEMNVFKPARVSN